MTYHIGNLTVAYLALIIPFVVVLLLGVTTYLRRPSYRRRFTGLRLLWEMWFSTIALGVILFGVFGWYLFWRPFYNITITPDGTWQLEYAMLRRNVSVDPANIRALSITDERLPIRRSGQQRQYVLIELNDGRVFSSAPAAQSDINQLVEQLRSRLSG